MKGYIETKQKFLKQKNEDIIKTLKKEFSGENPPVKAWENLINDIKKSAKFKELPEHIIIGMECACTTGGMQIDLLIAYVNKNDEKCAFIIEAKNWSDDYIKTLTFSDNRRRDNTLHPQIQVQRQALSFQGYTDIGGQYFVTPYVYVKCSQSGIEEIIEKNPDSDSTGVKITNNIDVIMNEIRNSVRTYCNEFEKLDMFSELRNTSYSPSKSVTQAMQSIISNDQAFILTDKQQQVLDGVIKNIKDGKKIIRIKGSAGSGKTAILIQLYLELAKDKEAKFRPILVPGAYNTDYYRSLYSASSGVFEFSHALKGIINSQEKYRYVVLMDEAQHNDKGEISKLLKMNATIVVCYDETQAIRAVNCVNELQHLESRSDFVSIELSDSMRYNGSKIAEQNIKNYLDGKPLVGDELFDLQISNSFQDFQSKLKDLIDNHPKATIATVGLLCNDLDKYTYKGNPDSILKTRWFDKAECKWMKYVNEKNYLQDENDKIWVGTWWMQGLDVDYVAVIVGDDATLTEDGIKADMHKSRLYQTMISVAENMGLPNNLYNKEAKIYAENIVNYIDKSDDEQLKLEFEIEFSKYVRNYYYIMLTRGRKGCLVYFANSIRK